MTLQETVSKIVGKEVTIEFAMEFANNQFGLLATYLREKSEMSIDKAKETLSDNGYFGITWTLPDIIQRAEDDGYIIDEKQAKQIAKNIDRAHDCNIGIDWNNITYHIEEYCDEHNIGRVEEEHDFFDGEDL